MATVQNTYESQLFRVIHPLDDVLERKCTSDGLGPIEMTRSARISLMILRGYLIAMTALLVFHVLDLAGVLHRLGS